jgi:hypothetical protein
MGWVNEIVSMRGRDFLFITSPAYGPTQVPNLGGPISWTGDEEKISVNEYWGLVS